MFYSPQITVNKQGQNKFYDIPIDKRIIVLEDVDCLTDLVLDRSLVKEAKEDEGSQGSQGNKGNKGEDAYYHNMHMQSFAQVSNEKVTLSTLLNILDGVLEQPGRILIMTSNHPEKLDKALIRPGRIDVIVKFDFCKPHEIAEIVEAFTGVALNENQSSKLQSGVYTPAEVTQAIFENIENVDAIVHALGKTKKQVVATVPTVETVETVETVPEVLEVLEVLEVPAIQTSPISEIAIQTVQTVQTAQTVQTVSAIPAVKGVPEIPTTTVVNNTLYSPTERKPIERECIGKILNGMCGQETQLDDFFKLL
jgi:SpoVK/Ycf46/Vps4 family AAA+-type ATPase